jgi:hypothetical protein
MASKIQLRRGTAAEWAGANPVLSEGEIGFEVDANAFKIGDGVAAWNSLPYAVGSFISGKTGVWDNFGETGEVIVGRTEPSFRQGGFGSYNEWNLTRLSDRRAVYVQDSDYIPDSVPRRSDYQWNESFTDGVSDGFTPITGSMPLILTSGLQSTDFPYYGLTYTPTRYASSSGEIHRCSDSSALYDDAFEVDMDSIGKPTTLDELITVLNADFADKRFVTATYNGSGHMSSMPVLIIDSVSLGSGFNIHIMYQTTNPAIVAEGTTLKFTFVSTTATHNFNVLNALDQVVGSLTMEVGPPAGAYTSVIFEPITTTVQYGPHPDVPSRTVIWCENDPSSQFFLSTTSYFDIQQFISTFQKRSDITTSLDEGIAVVLEIEDSGRVVEKSFLPLQRREIYNCQLLRVSDSQVILYSGNQAIAPPGTPYPGDWNTDITVLDVDAAGVISIADQFVVGNDDKRAAISHTTGTRYVCTGNSGHGVGGTEDTVFLVDTSTSSIIDSVVVEDVLLENGWPGTVCSMGGNYTLYVARSRTIDEVTLRLFGTVFNSTGNTIVEVAPRSLIQSDDGTFNYSMDNNWDLQAFQDTATTAVLVSVLADSNGESVFQTHLLGVNTGTGAVTVLDKLFEPYSVDPNVGGANKRAVLPISPGKYLDLRVPAGGKYLTQAIITSNGTTLTTTTTAKIEGSSPEADETIHTVGATLMDDKTVLLAYMTYKQDNTPTPTRFLVLTV